MNQPIEQAQEQLFAIAKTNRRVSGQSLQHQNDLSSIETNKQQARLLFNDIVKTACLPHLTVSKENLKIINHSSILMPQYLWVLKKISVSISPAQAAASSKMEISVRKTEQFELHVSNEQQDEAYAKVLLKLNHVTSTQRQAGCHLHLVLNNKCSVLSFLSLKETQSELTLKKSSQEFAFLMNDDTQIHLS